MVSKYVVFCIPLLLCTILFVGCESLKGVIKPSEEVARTPDEIKKEKLLKRIDRKFENPKAHFKLGRLYQTDGLWIQAEREYNVVLGFDPVHREAQAAMVKVLENAGDADRAGLSAEFYMNQASSSASASLKLGLAFQKQGLDDYALDCYRQSLHLAPNSARINKQIGFYYLSKGSKIQAQDYLARSFQLDSNQPEVAGELGRLGVRIKRPVKIQKDTKKLDKVVDKATEVK